MSRAVIVVRTANRPEILNRCIEAAVAACSVAREAFWVILDDSSCDYLGASGRNAVLVGVGLRIAYVDKTVEEVIADSLPGAAFRRSFLRLAARPASCPTDGGRILPLSLVFRSTPMRFSSLTMTWSIAMTGTVSYIGALTRIVVKASLPHPEPSGSPTSLSSND